MNEQGRRPFQIFGLQTIRSSATAEVVDRLDGVVHETGWETLDTIFTRGEMRKGIFWEEL